MTMNTESFDGDSRIFQYPTQFVGSGSNRAFAAAAPTHGQKNVVLNILANKCDFLYSLLDRNMNMQSTTTLLYKRALKSFQL